MTSVPERGQLRTDLASPPLTDEALPFAVPNASLSMVYAPNANLYGHPLDTWGFYVKSHVLDSGRMEEQPI